MNWFISHDHHNKYNFLIIIDEKLVVILDNIYFLIIYDAAGALKDITGICDFRFESHTINVLLVI